jgi:hypothetical protein
MGKHQINKGLLKQAEEIMRANGSRLAFVVALCDDENIVDVVKNDHMSEADFMIALELFVKKYPAALALLRAKQN